MKQLIKSLKLIFTHPLNRGKPFTTLLRLIWWKVNQIIFHLPVIHQITPNRKCVCYPESSYGGLIVYLGMPEYEGNTYILNNLKPNDTFIDVGACIGDYSFFASSIITEGHIYAFEPYKKSIEMFEENIRLNNLKNISIFKGVASDKNGYEYLRIEKESEVNHIVNKKSRHNEIRVRSITLDTFIAENNIKQVSILKIDVEGSEMKVLIGAEKSIQDKKIKKILIELNKNNQFFGTNNHKIITWLKKQHFNIYMFEEQKVRKMTSVNEIENDQILNVLAVRKTSRRFFL